ncbi:MAG: ATP-binding protein [Alphaproteobacteria bacterium]|nr:ATP-binding protein [Alphaproteobacteria bacterium]
MPSRIKRTLAKPITEVSDSFKVLLLTGPRQVGKTTLLQNIDKKLRSYVTLDDLTQRTAAQEDPAGFIERLQLPVLIDEVQYAPNLFPYIKMAVDKARKMGQFWLTGSQQFDMMKNITESLAGRVGILHLQGITLAEEQNRSNDAPFLPELKLLKARQKSAKILTVRQVFQKIWRGSYPDMVTRKGKNWERFYDSYVSTYIQRDVQDYLGIKSKTTFLKFMQIAAARTGQLVNYADISKDVGVSQVTIKSWLNVLQASGIIMLLQPFFKNQTKRLVKTPKLYFMDTGLCAFLTGWLNPDVLERGAMSGAMLETYVVSEIIKSYLHQGRVPRVYFYRDNKKNEVDLLIEENGTLYPIEIKKTSSPKRADCKAFDYLQGLKMPIGHGGVICFTSALTPLADNIDAIPLGYL